ncbi:hypothetical protein HY357_03550 [Candidatus Roizmanbacteria bacterium]|nr:hypothetical protein [Candidatus Roizmanbacteria bacterium]
MSKLKYFLLSLLFFTQTHPVVALISPSPTPCPTGSKDCIQASERDIGFKIPDLSDILTFAIRGFFIVAGLLALMYLLLGAMAWVTSGGNKENVDKARDKITAAVLGVILIVAVLAIIVTLEQIVFGGRLCLGLTCPITIPSLLKAPAP